MVFFQYGKPADNYWTDLMSDLLPLFIKKSQSLVQDGQVFRVDGFCQLFLLRLELFFLWSPILKLILKCLEIR